MVRFKLEDGAIVDTDRAAVLQRRIFQRWRQAIILSYLF